MRDTTFNYGFITPVITEDNYLLGGLSKLPITILQESGQWDFFLPEYEPQAERFETSGCVVWGSENCVEILHKKLYGTEPNYSERFIYILAGVTLEGSDPHIVNEVIRKVGLIDHKFLPVPEAYKEFIQPNPMTEKLLKEGEKWLEKYDFMHEWVFKGNIRQEEKISRMKYALQRSPLGVSVSAWHRDGEIYTDQGFPNNHWCVCFGWNELGWKIFDSYDHSVKIYSFDSEIGYCKRFHLEKKSSEIRPEIRANWVIELVYNFLDFIKDLLKK